MAGSRSYYLEEESSKLRGSGEEVAHQEWEELKKLEELRTKENSLGLTL